MQEEMEESRSPLAPQTPFGDTALGACIGVAIAIFALCVGVGSCDAMRTLAGFHQQAKEVSVLTEQPVGQPTPTNLPALEAEKVEQ